MRVTTVAYASGDTFALRDPFLVAHGVVFARFQRFEAEDLLATEGVLPSTSGGFVFV